MAEKNKKILLIFLCGILITSTGFFCISIKNVSAAGLQIEYPALPGGVQLTDINTPLPEYLKYVFDFGMFLGLAFCVFSLAYAGVLYLLSPAKPELLSSAKDRVAGVISGFLILMMTYLIITALNPQLAILKIGNLNTAPAPNQGKEAGVYFYKSNNCSDTTDANTSNIGNFEEKNNQINSAMVVSSAGQEYVSTMYESPGLFGRCQNVDPNNNGCQQMANFSSSASIHVYDFNPQGDGVYLYRKPFFNTDGGWVRISNSQIESEINGGVFGEEFKNLTFSGNSPNSPNNCNVPEDEKICKQWDDKGECTQKDCPPLTGKEISSMKIAGNYVVFFLYVDPKDNPSGPWTYCQEFPTPNDTNKDGPKQLKWEKSINQKNIPNWIYIYPVKNK